MKTRIGFAMLGLVCLFAFSGIALANEREGCLRSLSVIEKPVFSGLRSMKFISEEGSAEGGESYVFSDHGGQPVYVLISEYGETGKRVALYKFMNGVTHSFAARVSNYSYVQPIYADQVTVASVHTISFIVCNGSALRGVGSIDVEDETVKRAKADVFRTIEEFNARSHGGRERVSGSNER